jgi:TetR/AcrR family transcriptional repressor of nem operon
VKQTVGARINLFLHATYDPLQGLRTFFTSVLRPHAGEQRLRGCLLTTTAGHAESVAPDIRAALDRGLNAIEGSFREQIERAKGAGQLSADIDTNAVAKALLMSFQGLLVMARSGVINLQDSIDATFLTLTPRS